MSNSGVIILGATAPGPDPGTVLIFQRAILSLESKDPDLHLGAKMWPPTDQERRRIVDGVYGPNTKKAAARWNSYYRGVPGDGDRITEGTIASLPKVEVIPTVAPESSSPPPRQNQTRSPSASTSSSENAWSQSQQEGGQSTANQTDTGSSGSWKPVLAALGIGGVVAAVVGLALRRRPG